MNIKILLFIIFAVSITSCSTVYKNTQTPDDVYYSPVRVQEENSHQDQQRDNVKSSPVEDRHIRMAVYDRRWRDFNDDYDYRYDPYTYGYSYGYYYNPYYCNNPVYITNVAIVNPKNATPRMTNLGSYNTNNLSYANTKTTGYNRVSSQRYNNSNNNNTFIRRIFSTPTTSSTNNSNTTTNNSTESNTTRSYTPSSSSSSSSSSSGSSGGSSVSRPSRGN